MVVDLQDYQRRMEKSLGFLQDELAQIKTGRATPALIEKIMINAYETTMPLVELATINAPSANELVITPFDQTILREIERGIGARRDLGLSARVDSEVIRITIPALTTERRGELVKVLNQKLEMGQVSIRQTRHDARAVIKRQFEEDEIHEDERRDLQEELEKITTQMKEKIEVMGKVKKTEIGGGD
ncbi:ribosome recycling factor [Patescibacteria group bacterium]|nr:ribosome recycling factor [Patescibacteria group bacterium]